MPSPQAPQPSPQPAQAARGLALGLLAVVIFALTLPMTRLAVGDASAPQLPPLFVTLGRAAAAGVLALGYLLVLRVPRPRGGVWPWLALSALCTVVGFPLGLAMALREVPSAHAAVVSGVIPLGTAVAAALLTRQRASLGFWACALLGCGLVLAYAWWAGDGGWVRADAWLLMAVASAAVGYVAGARATQTLGPQATISWVLVLSLPLTVPATLWAWPGVGAGGAAAWAGFAYVSVMSMWLGFFAWYRALALGGVMRVSQVQLLQPFFALLAAVPLLGEPLEPVTLSFALAVAVVVFVGRRMPVGPPVAAGR